MIASKLIVQAIDLEAFLLLVRTSEETISFNVLAVGFGITICAKIFGQVFHNYHNGKCQHSELEHRLKASPQTQTKSNEVSLPAVIYATETSIPLATMLVCQTDTSGKADVSTQEESHSF
jgi:hypothetical protein